LLQDMIVPAFCAKKDAFAILKEGAETIAEKEKFKILKKNNSEKGK